MRKLLLLSCVAAPALIASGAAFANDELVTLQKDAKNWVMPAGNYNNQRYSALNQITNKNVKDLVPAWSFSTGVLRGHEGGPLVIGDVMYFSTPFPNIVYALDLNNDGKILWKYEPKQDPSVIPVMCCDTVNRGVAYGDGKIFLHQADTTLVALDAKTGAPVWQVKDGDPSKGSTGTSAPLVVKDKVLIGVSGGEFGVRGWVSAYNIVGRQARLARLLDGSGCGHPDRSRKDHRPRQAGRRELLHQHLGRRSVEDRRRRDLGLDLLRSRAEPRLLRVRQPLDLEPGAASRRQQMVDVDLGA